jgi:hypothetical protein
VSGSEREPIKGRQADSHNVKKTLYAEGRICAQEGCATILSRYNRRSYCWQHDDTRPYFVRGLRRGDR